MMAMKLRALVFAQTALAFTLPSSAGTPQLGLPIACDIGKTCWVQQYPDHDPGPGATDYACGTQTYDGHQGIDIRIRDTSQSADVIAAAAGTVKAVRDGVDDHLMKTEQDRAAVGDQECGNGVVVAHGEGWETQYCHLRKGTVAVKPGDTVTLGQKLGEVGYSGMAAFPHVHLTVRQDGTVVDPFRSSGSECGGMADPLWAEDVRASLAYHQGDIIAFGAAPAAVDMPQLESGSLASLIPKADWPAMVAYGLAINLSAGDVVTITLEGPQGFSAGNSVTLDRAKAQYMLFAGKKQPRGGWPKGDYSGRVTIGQEGNPRLKQQWNYTLR